MNSSLSASLASYRSLEIDAHVSLDDVLSKITQEMGELMEALENNDTSEIQKEAKDLLVNLLSASSRLGIGLFPDLTLSRIEPREIPQKIAIFHRMVAAIRSRYSRELHPPISEIRNLFDPLIATLLDLSGSDSHESVVTESIQKLRSRISEYVPLVELKDAIDEYPDFPKPGILFKDISPILRDEFLMRYASYEMAKHAKDADVIAGLDARGFIFGARVAEILEKPFVMVRKKGKLPGKTSGVGYSLEYGENAIEIQDGAIEPGQKVAIIDDLLATGGTLGAAASLVEKVGGKVSSLVCLISLDDPFLMSLESRKLLSESYPVKSILHYS
ncbi:MAG: hypothetical protein HHAS10_03460 [Candidatus Altimarinota bacterium]